MILVPKTEMVTPFDITVCLGDIHPVGMALSTTMRHLILSPVPFTIINLINIWEHVIPHFNEKMVTLPAPPLGE